MRVHWWLTAALLVGCGVEEEPVRAKDRMELARLPRASADPIRVHTSKTIYLDDESRTEDFENVDLVVRDGAGAEVMLEPVTWQDVDVGWAPASGWVPGEGYTLEQAGEVELDEPLAFEVGTWGSVTLDPGELVGRGWALDGGWSVPGDVVPLAAVAAEVVVRIDAVEGDQVAFSVIGDAGPGPCVLLRDRGTWSGSTLSWERPAWTLDPRVQPIEAWDFALEVFFDGPHAEASAQFRGMVDADPVGALVLADHQPGDACALAAGFGATCLPCEDAECLAASAYSAALLPVDPPLDPLPRCGVSPSTGPMLDIEPIDCDLDLDLASVDCGCATGGYGTSAGIPFWIALLTVLRRRSTR